MSIVDGEVVLENGLPVPLDRDPALRELTTPIAGWRGRLAARGSRAVFGPGSACCR